ncbi:Cytochrome b-c1 complex subunit 6 [Colletotrichum spinosum]|uniref:Cytochrome b-c1 complex subunit 6, mitochondrial n=1 Tax=Colletotrichum spinosum TaxID=1347390 RepID=A0A4R8Q655_9PEZI|nr:Cytochrome b-c1 complex subunit 6 [Colletotrichum spinosum]
MGFWDTITDLAEAAMPWATVEAEAPAAEEKEEETPAEETKEEPEAEAEAEEEEEEEEEEDEDDEEEPVDPKDQIEEECKESKACAPAKHHYDECVERVTAAADSEDGAKEDCVEEFFHLAHCATQCAAPKLWAQLK